MGRQERGSSAAGIPFDLRARAQQRDAPVGERIAGAALGGVAIGVERERSGHASGRHARFAGIRTFTLLGGLAGVIGGNYQVTEPAMAFTMGPIVFVVVVFGGLGSLAGCFIASILMGLIQTFAVVINTSLLDLIKPLGVTVSGDNLFTEILTVPVARIGALLPFAMMIVMLLFRPRGLMGTRDT